MWGIIICGCVCCTCCGNCCRFVCVCCIPGMPPAVPAGKPMGICMLPTSACCPPMPIPGSVALPVCCGDATAPELLAWGWLLPKPAKASISVRDAHASLAEGAEAFFGDGGIAGPLGTPPPRFSPSITFFMASAWPEAP